MRRANAWPSGPVCGRERHGRARDRSRGARGRRAARCVPGPPGAELSRARAKEMVERGDVVVEGRRVSKSHRVAAGERILIAELPSRVDFYCAPDLAMALDVRVETPRLRPSVDKPAGVPAHPLTPRELGTLAGGLVARYHPEMRDVGYSRREPGILHRLDTGTSGVMLAARNATAFKHLRETASRGGNRKALSGSLCRRCGGARTRRDSDRQRSPAIAERCERAQTQERSNDLARSPREPRSCRAYLRLMVRSSRCEPITRAVIRFECISPRSVIHCLAIRSTVARPWTKRSTTCSMLHRFVWAMFMQSQVFGNIRFLARTKSMDRSVARPG